MLFSSFAFLFLFPFAALIYALLRRNRNRLVSQAWLLAVSIAFYCYSALHQLPLLLGSILFNWAVGRQVGDADAPQETRHRWVVFGVVCNVLFLSTFKYINFFLSTARPLIGFQFALPNWSLPLGISFFTVTQIMYLVDCYEQVVPANNLFDHATFVSFFPYVIAGPLSRAKMMVEQFRSVTDAIPVEEVARGLALFILGFFKKTVLADSLAKLADSGVADPSSISTIDTWVAVLAYSLQIYFDFSGYSDMALGIARMLGFTIPINFEAPYKSRSIIEFWQRWHISLSRFITHYLYTPILRGFKGRATLAKSAVATILAMTISGLWHGPAWTFVVWGLLHGLALGTNQYWRKKWKIPIPSLASWALTFGFVVLAEVFFRAPTLHAALGTLARLLPLQGIGPALATELIPHQRDSLMEVMTYMIPSAAALPLALLGPSSNEIVDSFRPRYSNVFAYSGLALAALLFLNSVQARRFVYFGF